MLSSLLYDLSFHNYDSESHYDLAFQNDDSISENNDLAFHKYDFIS